jgi:alkanesulfonate monooxygenase SsuD/methylene tetrahydromethanopterin reductase-like flavin-dependent oxidoreductase (luciferase family)
LAVVKRLWTEEAVSVENDVCKLEKVTMTIRPIQQPHPPIWFAATTNGAVERAARLGDTWLIGPHATFSTLKQQIALYRGELTRLGRPFPRVLPMLREIYCARDRRTALEVAGPHLASKYGAYARWGQDEALPGKETFQRPFEDLLQDRFILGSPEECYEQLLPYCRELGVNYLILRTHWSGLPLRAALGSMRLIADELMPALRRTAGTNVDPGLITPA